MNGFDPCPHCGSTDIVVSTFALHGGGICADAICQGCSASVGSEEIYDTVEDAVEGLKPIWNRRYEDTCSLELDLVHRDFVCSRCGERLATPEYMSVNDEDDIYFKKIGYCPGCGRKVVSDEE